MITHGTNRVSEVAARFTLDSLPGRQMAIDADLQAGAIKDTEARQRRRELQLQADFYGAMMLPRSLCVETLWPVW